MLLPAPCLLLEGAGSWERSRIASLKILTFSGCVLQLRKGQVSREGCCLMGGPAGNSKPCLLSVEACQVWSCPQLGQVLPPYPGAICPVTLGHGGSNRERRDGCRGGKTIPKQDFPECGARWPSGCAHLRQVALLSASMGTQVLGGWGGLSQRGGDLQNSGLKNRPRVFSF